MLILVYDEDGETLLTAYECSSDDPNHEPMVEALLYDLHKFTQRQGKERTFMVKYKMIEEQNNEWKRNNSTD